MEDNPYSLFIDSIRQEVKEQMPTTFRNGVVTDLSPVKVTMGGIELAGAGLYINPMLTSKYINENDRIQKGDTVLLLESEDRQSHYIITKVART